MDGTKLGRVIDQLKGIMIKSPDSSGSTTTPDSKGESFEVLSSDDEKEVEPTTSKKPSTSLEARGGSTVGEYLKREKAKHLAKQKNDKMDKPENPHVLPKSVSWSELEICYITFWILSVATLKILSSRLMGTIIFFPYSWVSSKVMEVMQKVAEPPAFALKSQYVTTVKEARAAAGVEDAADDEETPEDVKNDNQGTKRKTRESDGKEWNYASVRKSFIQKEQQGGFTYKAAMDKWDSSEEKRLYLCDVSVKELKRRKFIPRDATTNPWGKPWAKKSS